MLITSSYPASKKLLFGKKSILAVTSEMAASILYRLFVETSIWPVDFMEIYLDDALGCRQWVDSLDESVAFFCKNITSSPSLLDSSSINHAVEQMHADIDGDEEILEEEILEEGGVKTPDVWNKPTLNLSLIQYRFSDNSETVKLLVERILVEKCRSTTTISVEDLIKTYGYQNTQKSTSSERILESTSQSGTWALVLTVSTFLYDTLIRLIATYCIDKWLNNPALVSYVKIFLHQLSFYLGSTSDQSNSIVSDIQIIRELIKLRNRIKPIHFDTFKTAIIDIAMSNQQRMTIIVNILIEEDILLGSLRSETLTLISNVLQSMNANNRKYEQISLVLGNSVKEIFIKILNHPLRPFIEWNSALSRMFCDFVVKLIRLLGVKDFSFEVFLQSALPSTNMLSDIARLDDLGLPIFCLIHDVCISCQLSVMHEIVILEKEKRGKKSDEIAAKSGKSVNISTIATNTKNLKDSSSFGIFNVPKQPLASRAVGGKVRSVPISSSSSGGLFRSCNISTSKSLLLSNKSSNTDSQQLLPVMADSADDIIPIDNEELKLIILQQELLLHQSLALQEVICGWIESLILLLLTEVRSKEYKLSLQSSSSWIKYIMMSLMISSEAMITIPVSCEVVDKSASFALRSFGCISDKLLHSICTIIRYMSFCIPILEQGINFIELVVLRAVKTSYSGFSSINSSNKIDDSTLHQRINSVQVINNDTIAKMLSISLVNIISDGAQSDSLHNFLYLTPIPLSIFSNNSDSCKLLESYEKSKQLCILPSIESTKTHRIPIYGGFNSNMGIDYPYIPNVSHEQFYWKLCGLLCLICSAKLSTIGRYAWNNIPSIRNLMLMTMTGRYYHSPLAAIEEEKNDCIIGEDLNTLSEADDLVMRYRHENGIELYVHNRNLQITMGKLRDIDTCVKEFEKSVLSYYLDEVPAVVDSKETSSSQNVEFVDVQDTSKNGPVEIDLEEPQHINSKKRNIHEIDLTSMSSKRLKIMHSQTVPVNEYTNSCYTTNFGSISSQELIIFNLGASSPRPTDTVIQSISNYDSKFEIGTLLRGSADPDLITSSISSDESIKGSLNWLVPTIYSDIEGILMRLPDTTTAQILMMVSHKMYLRFAEYNMWGNSNDSLSASFSDVATTINGKNKSYYGINSTSELFGVLISMPEHLVDVALVRALSKKLLLRISTSKGTEEDLNLSTILLRDIDSPIPSRREHNKFIWALFYDLQLLLDSCNVNEVLMRGKHLTSQFFHIIFMNWSQNLKNAQIHEKILNYLLLESNLNVVVEIFEYLLLENANEFFVDTLIYFLSNRPHHTEQLLVIFYKKQVNISNAIQPLCQSMETNQVYSKYCTYYENTKEETHNDDRALKESSKIYQKRFVELSPSASISISQENPKQYHVRVDAVRGLVLLYMYQSFVISHIDFPDLIYQLFSRFKFTDSENLDNFIMRNLEDIYAIFLTSTVSVALFEKFLSFQNILFTNNSITRCMLPSSETSQYLCGLSLNALQGLLEHLSRSSETSLIEDIRRNLCKNFAERNAYIISIKRRFKRQCQYLMHLDNKWEKKIKQLRFYDEVTQM